MSEKKSILPVLLIACFLSFFIGLIVASQLDLPSLTRAEEPPTPNLSPSSSPSSSTTPFVFSGEESPFVAVAREVMPSVVSIQVEGRVRGTRSNRFEGPWDDLFKDFFRSPEENSPPRHFTSAGTGVIIDPAGYILTNNHVVEGAKEISVVLHDETIFRSKDVKVVGTDPRTDLAVLKVKTDQKLKAVRLGDSDAIQVGDWAIAIGNPFGYRETVTV
ncbi:trypsin-like peptidase domain-containing protein, partial [candidate division TA06 bacterium]|nr:trypsin-like peptidase domain-containing protein [candidate division TA06 bacterium]